MITPVLDTNVLASGFVRRNPSSPPVQLVEAWRAHLYTLVISEHIITELDRTFLESYFRQRITNQRATRAVAVLRRRATPPVSLLPFTVLPLTPKMILTLPPLSLPVPTTS